MENPLLRRVPRTRKPETNRYEALGLKNNPFPIDPGLSPGSGDPRVNGSIYNNELFIDKQNQLDRLLIPGNNGAHSIGFLMDHATRRGRGIGKSAFLKHQRDRITDDFGWEASKGTALLYAVHVIDLPPKKESSYNVSKLGQKGGINGKENLHSGANHQQAKGS